MEWLAVVTMICVGTPDTKFCEKQIKSCIEWVVDQPETKKRGADNEMIAYWFLTNEKAKLSLCKAKFPQQ